MGKRESVDVNFVAQQAEQAERAAASINQKLKLLDKEIKELQKHWKSTEANQVYKKLKGTINGHYEWLHNLSNCNNQLMKWKMR